MRNLMRVMLLLLLCAFGVGYAVAQPSTISGNVNTVYSAVSNVNTVANSLTVNSVAGFNMGDSVLIIQMKGAEMNTANAATFGDITAINSAGKYEINIVCDIQGFDLIMERTLLNTYNLTGKIQVIKIPSYSSVVVNGPLTAPAWDGNTGGVLVFGASEWVRLDADISMNGMGFKNGWDHSNYAGQGCDCACAGGQYTAFLYPALSCRAADKGEGIADSIVAMAFGKGKESTGGGGGNDHNAGGGGGGNYGAGGNGGNSNNPTCFAGAYCRGLNAGVGGVSLNTAGFISNAQNRIFMGGGGGAGHDNNGTGTGGVRGGGIVIIIADSLHLNGRTISARGNSQLTQATSDGSGGGGAGGTIVLSTRVVLNSAGTLNVSGGSGGIDSWTVNTQGCKGPGGGGGGGAIWAKFAIPGLVTPIVGGGTNGTNCSGANGAQAGGAGGVLTGLILPISGSTFPPCVLPVEYLYFQANAAEDLGVELAWGTASEQRNRQFKIERSANGHQFSTIGSVASTSSYGEGQAYTWIDHAPLKGTNWYRIKQVDLNGASSLSEVRMVVYGTDETVVGDIHPNPVGSQGSMGIDVYVADPKASSARLSIHDMTGRVLSHREFSLQQGNNPLEIPLGDWARGSYFMEIQIAGQQPIFRRFSISGN